MMTAETTTATLVNRPGDIESKLEKQMKDLEVATHSRDKTISELKKKMRQQQKRMEEADRKLKEQQAELTEQKDMAIEMKKQLSQSF